MTQAQRTNLITNASVSKNTSWILTATGVGVDTQTITIGGVVFTTVTTIGSTAGNVLLGANQAATLTNLVALITTPGTTTSTGVALSAADITTLNRLGISASTTATAMTIVSSNASPITVSETETNMAWTSIYTSGGQPGGENGRMSFQFIAASITSGNGVFTVDVSNDGINWIAYNRLTTNVTNTNAQTDTRVASVTLSSNTNAVVSIPDSFSFYRANVVPTTDGLYSVTSYAS